MLNNCSYKNEWLFKISNFTHSIRLRVFNSTASAHEREPNFLSL